MGGHHCAQTDFAPPRERAARSPHRCSARRRRKRENCSAMRCAPRRPLPSATIATRSSRGRARRIRTNIGEGTGHEQAFDATVGGGRELGKSGRRLHPRINPWWAVDPMKTLYIFLTKRSGGTSRCR
jgi:hypothetical protein